ncbi:MAG: ribonuclease P protein component [Dysgonamonadaceae bacterium]|nr:ribonuclease P protein component [Dysgonamonadaceae bacterium]
MENLRNTLKKEERISAQKEIDLLFEKGASFVSFPLRVVYLVEKPLSGASVAILVSVPKRKFKRAVKRNRIKRLVKEAYRRNKHPLVNHFQENTSGLLLAFLFVGNALCGYKEIESAVGRILITLKEKHQHIATLPH